MLIRKALDQDIPAIIQLMRDSLGESLIPKSERLWRWKHEDNPFGESFVLVAEEDGMLIGLRAFMQWQWRRNNEVFKAVRAVDTGTHKNHQGKGIFKKLTLQQVEECRQQGVHFVFNTPNENSRPGYLKMGWVEQGRMPIKIKIRRPVNMAMAKLTNRKLQGGASDPTPRQEWNFSQMPLSLLQSYKQPETAKFETPLSEAYIKWRYADCPLYNYNYLSNGKDYLLICRIKEQAIGRELRLVDLLVFGDNRKAANEMKKEAAQYCSRNKIDFISISGTTYEQYKNLLSWMGPLPVTKSGPIVTLRDLNMGDAFASMTDVSKWDFSVGAMELF